MTDSVEHPPIYFSSLELENVRCFEQRQTLDLTNENGTPVQWILILGDNGVGKTTLLQCLAWMRPVPSMDEEGKFKTIEPALNSEEENRALDSLIRIGADVSVTLKATLSVGQTLGSTGGETAATTLATEITMQGQNGILRDRKLGQNGILREGKMLAEHGLTHLREVLRSDLAIFAYGAARRSGTLKPDRGGLSDPLASLFWSSTELYDAEDLLLKLHHRAAIGKAEQGEEHLQHEERLQRIKRILATVLPNVGREDHIRILGPAIFSDSAESSGVRFETPYGLVPLSALSLGYQTTLTWIVDLALRLYERYPESAEPLSEPGIVLIDSIDLHLHPRWQRQMMKDLTGCFPAIQFVATAHSPLIAQAAENANLAVLREENGKVIIKRHPQSVNTWRADQILASDLFDIPTRSGSIQKLIKERDELLDKMKRNQSEEERLQLLEEKLDLLPTAESPEDRAAMELIRSVAARLKDNGSHQS